MGNPILIPRRSHRRIGVSRKRRVIHWNSYSFPIEAELWDQGVYPTTSVIPSGTPSYGGLAFFCGPFWLYHRFVGVDSMSTTALRGDSNSHSDPNQWLALSRSNPQETNGILFQWSFGVPRLISLFPGIRFLSLLAFKCLVVACI